MARTRASQPAHVPWWLWATMLLAALWYGFRYYQRAQQGEMSPSLPVRVSRETARAVHGRAVVLISGHEGYDSGALCENGLAEVDVNREISGRVAGLLREAGAKVDVLAEYDDRLEGMEADVLVSVHADSCVAATGFKVARWVDSPSPERDDRLVRCLTENYAALTHLPFDTRRITEDMTQYHAFRKIADTTPAAIIEVGYLGGDGVLLTEKPQIPALGIAEGIGCFLAQQK